MSWLMAADGDPNRLKWQRRIERESIRKVPPIVRPSIRGIARKAG